MAKTTKRPAKKSSKIQPEANSVYFLKILMYFILGTVWVRLVNVNIGAFHDISLPIGLVVGLLFASHEHFQIDSKVEFAILIIAAFISFYLPVGFLF